MTTSNGNGINHLVFLEDFRKGDFGFELGESPIDLLSSVFSTIYLNFEEMTLLLSEFALLNLSCCNNSDN